MKLTPFVLMLTGALAPSLPAQNLLQNGSFETDAAWTLSPNNVAFVAGQGATEGLRAAALTYGNLLGGVLSQTFAAEQGTGYVLSFDFGNYSVNQNGLTARILVSVYDGNFVGQEAAYNWVVSDVNSSNSASDASVFQPFQFEFTALSTGNATLRFVDASDGQFLGGGFDPMLDNVRISRVTSIPEPVPSTALLGLASALIAGYGRRTRRLST